MLTNNEVFLGKNLIQKKSEFSEITSIAIDKEVRRLANTALEIAIKLLSSKRRVMDQLVNVLIEDETINHDKFVSIVSLSGNHSKLSISSLSNLMNKVR